jgi:hypothetical protein
VITKRQAFVGQSADLINVRLQDQPIGIVEPFLLGIESVIPLVRVHSDDDVPSPCVRFLAQVSQLQVV